MIRKILVLTLCVVLALSCNKSPKPVQEATLEDLVSIFKSGVALESFTEEGESVFMMSLRDGRKYSVAGSLLSMQTAMQWPEIALDENDQWLVNGQNSGKSLTAQASAIVATHRDENGLWMRLDDGSFLFYLYTGTKSFASFRIEKASNPELSQDIVPGISGSDVSIRESDFAPIKVRLKANIAVWGHSLTLDGQPYVNGVSYLPAKGAKLSYTDYSGNQQFISVNSDLRPRLPIIEISTENKTPITSKEVYIPANFNIRDDYEFYGGSNACEISGQIRGRGNSTWDMPKKPYRIKFNEKVKLMGMPKSKHWALLANYSDKTLLRNSAAMRISQACDVLSWTPRHRNVEVYLNGEYLGVYSAFETVRPDKDRVPIDISGVDDGTDITGGYFIEVDEKEGNLARWRTSKNVPMSFKEPEEPTQEQIDYLKEYIRNVENTLYYGKASDPEKGYRAYIDVESFAANYIVQELTKNVDGNFRLSTFLAKYKGDEHLYVSNVWDFDLALGNCDYVPGGNGPTGFIIRDCVWYTKLCADSYFRNAVKEIWAKVYPEIDNIIADLREESSGMREAIDRNFRKWNILRSYVWPNYFPSGTYDEHLGFMLDYLRERADWLNAELSAW